MTLRRLSNWTRLVALASALAAPAGLLAAPPPSEDEPVAFSADEVIYDKDLRITRAIGNVRISQDDRLLLADTVVVNQNQDLVTATGNVVLIEPTGETTFANYVELTGGLKTGVMKDMQTILSDGSRITSPSAKRTDGNVTKLRDATYTPCFTCRNDPDRTPIWHVKAVKVVHDQADRTITYDDAWLEVFDVPIGYTPYLTMPDPTVNRRTGLLPPVFGQSSDLGFVYKQPVFVVLDDFSDATLTPWITTTEGPVMQGEYRRALTNGAIDFGGSITRDSDDETRGAILGDVRMDLNENWRAGLDAQRATDRTYLRRYNFNTGNQRTLTSRLFAERFSRNDYLVANAYAFQGLDEGDKQSNTPFAAPWVSYYNQTGEDRLGGRTDMRLDSLALTRSDGTDTRRLSGRALWERPVVAPAGQLITFSGGMFTDGYAVDDLFLDDNDQFSGYSGRAFPQVGVDWRMPFVRDGESFSQVVEPRVEFIAAPLYGNPNKIPNEDSQGFELSDSNIFGMDRFPGLDRVEKGPRVNYGFQTHLFGPRQTNASFILGQTYRFYDTDEDLLRGTGLDGNISDLVAGVDVTPTDYLSILYSTRLDDQSFAVRRHELSTSIGVPAFYTNLSYVYYDGTGNPNENEEQRLTEEGALTTVDTDTREQVQFDIYNQWTRFWRTNIYGTRELTNGGSQRELGFRLIYEDECLLFGVEYERREFEDHDVDPTNQIFFRVAFKTVGEFGVSQKQ